MRASSQLSGTRWGHNTCVLASVSYEIGTDAWRREWWSLEWRVLVQRWWRVSALPVLGTKLRDTSPRLVALAAHPAFASVLRAHYQWVNIGAHDPMNSRSNWARASSNLGPDLHAG